MTVSGSASAKVFGGLAIPRNMPLTYGGRKSCAVAKQTYILAHAEARRRALQAVSEAPEGRVVTIAEPTRSLESNARMWAMLHDIAQQVEWYGKRLTPEDWKHVFSSALKKLEVVPNLDGSGFVALGLSTSKMSKREMSELMTLMEAFGAERGVIFKEADKG